MAKLLKETFAAWIDRMPGSPHKLFVKGQAEVPTGGWHVKLTPASPQGINPKILILDVSFIKPSGPATQVISKLECRYDESQPKHEYTDVTLRHDSDEFTIPVKDVE